MSIPNFSLLERDGMVGSASENQTELTETHTPHRVLPVTTRKHIDLREIGVCKHDVPRELGQPRAGGRRQCVVARW